MNTPTKCCKKCRTEYPITSEFFRHHKSGWIDTQCRSCERAYSAAYKEANRERLLEKQRKRYQENIEGERAKDRAAYQANIEDHRKKARDYQREKRKSPEYRKHQAAISMRSYYRHHEERKATMQRWREAHAEEHREMSKQYYYSHIEQVRERNKLYQPRWRIANRDKCRANQSRRRARVLAAQGNHDQKDIQSQYAAQHGKCWWCGKKLGAKYEVDHLIPLVRGGSNGPRNIVVTCRTCNRSKHDKLPHEWCGRLF